MSVNNYYIVNSCIYNKIDDPCSVDEEAGKIIQKSSELASSGRKVTVVLGLNAPIPTEEFPQSANDMEMEQTAERIKDLAAKLLEERNHIEVRVVWYRWERFDDCLRKDIFYEANQRVNYLAIRNNLFYSEMNQDVIRQTIETARKDNNASVKLLALDGDSQIAKDQIHNLETEWAEQMRVDAGSIHLSPLITTGYYRFIFAPTDKVLHQVDGNYNWGKFLAFTENNIDLKG